jgi:putative ribosome biogenesis GTPase RsgA
MAVTIWRSPRGQKWLCVTRGKKRDVATGDQVSFVPTSADQGVIEEILPRYYLSLSL